MLHVTGVCRQLRVVVPLASSMLLAAGALAQSPPPQQPPQVPGPALPPVQQAPVQPAPMPQNPVPQAAAPPPAPANPGLIEEFGKLLQNSASGLSSTWKGSQQTIDAIGSGAQGAVSGAAKGATDALISTTSQTMTKGRVACPMAGNGAPDCRAAAEQLCKTKGYRSGASLDIETAETCNAKVYISGRTGAPGECITRNFVTRAVCQ